LVHGTIALVPTNTTDHRLAQLRKLAWACAVLVLAITSLSAFIRLSRAGIGCEPWPQCHAQRAGMGAEQVAPLETGAVHTARIAHRIAASTALVLIIAMLFKTWASSPVLSRQGREVLALLGVALFLAVLGRLGGDSRTVGVALGNLVGGLLMFALACRLVAVSVPARPRHFQGSRLKPWVVGALVLMVLQVVLGGLMSTMNAGSRCDAGALCVAHWFSAAATALMVIPLGVAAWRQGALAGMVVAGLVALEALLGMGMMFTSIALPLALAHNMVAGLLMAAVAILLES
jgi:heme a synthase